MDGNAPEEDPPKDAGEHEEIDEGEDDEVAHKRDQGEFAKIVSYQWSCEEGTDEGDEDEAPEKADEWVVRGA